MSTPYSLATVPSSTRSRPIPCSVQDGQMLRLPKERRTNTLELGTKKAVATLEERAKSRLEWGEIEAKKKDAH